MKFSFILLFLYPLGTSLTYAQDAVLPMPVVNSEGSISSLDLFSRDNSGSITGHFSVAPNATSISKSNSSSYSEAPWQLIHDAKVRQDIELIGDQLDQAREIEKEFRDSLNSQMRQLTSQPITPELLKQMQAITETLKQKQQEKINAVLLPFQLKRLEEIAIQKDLKSNFWKTLSSKLVTERLKIGPKEFILLNKRREEVEKKLKLEIEQLKKKAREEILSGLSASQRQRLDLIMGDNFESDAPAK